MSLKREKVIGRKNPIFNSLDDGAGLCLCLSCSPDQKHMVDLRKSLECKLLTSLEVEKFTHREGFPFIQTNRDRFPWANFR